MEINVVFFLVQAWELGKEYLLYIYQLISIMPTISNLVWWGDPTFCVVCGSKKVRLWQIWEADTKYDNISAHWLCAYPQQSPARESLSFAICPRVEILATSSISSQWAAHFTLQNPVTLWSSPTYLSLYVRCNSSWMLCTSIQPSKPMLVVHYPLVDHPMQLICIADIDFVNRQIW